MAIKPKRFSRRTARFRTICEVHRELYDIIYDHPSLTEEEKIELLDKIEEVHSMGKRMDRKLKEYKYHITAEEWTIPERKVPDRGERKLRRNNRAIEWEENNE